MIDDDGVMRDAKEYLKHRNRTQVKATSSGRCGERFARGSAGNYVVEPRGGMGEEGGDWERVGAESRRPASYSRSAFLSRRREWFSWPGDASAGAEPVGGANPRRLEG